MSGRPPRAAGPVRRRRRAPAARRRRGGRPRSSVIATTIARKGAYRPEQPERSAAGRDVMRSLCHPGRRSRPAGRATTSAGVPVGDHRAEVERDDLGRRSTFSSARSCSMTTRLGAEVVADAFEQRRERLGLALRDAARRLVEEQDGAAAGAMTHARSTTRRRPRRQLVHELVAESPRARASSTSSSTRAATATLRVGDDGEVERGRDRITHLDRVVERDRDRLLHGQRGEEPPVLERAAEAGVRAAGPRRDVARAGSRSPLASPASRSTVSGVGEPRSRRGRRRASSSPRRSGRGRRGSRPRRSENETSSSAVIPPKCFVDPARPRAGRARAVGRPPSAVGTAAAAGRGRVVPPAPTAAAPATPPGSATARSRNTARTRSGR